jgi:hypothetical protein
MTWFRNRSNERPFPELLAAYADGELDAAGRARVEAWLVDHPEARTALEAQRKLSRRNHRLWQSSAGPAPGEASWSRLFARVHQALSAPPPATRRTHRFPYLVPLAAAAAVLLTVTLLKPTLPTDPRSGLPVEDAWVMAGDDDIEIVGILDADADRLVVGRPPLTGQIVLASVNDVTFVNVAEDTDGMKPQMPPPGATVPMVVAPLAGH